ncbi:AsmA-like C-terminal domain-containing protein [Poseidonibacter sp.]|uniref:YhdP family protein n=1 Tax=Poseidonibacter sp. TaxID=2321188 RepID=UPI003C771F1F
MSIENIEYKSKKSEVKNSFEDLKRNITLLPKVVSLFQKIDIERLKIDGNEFTISFNNDSLYLDNKFVNISSKVKFVSNKVIFDLYSLYLKDVKLLLDGKIKLDYDKEKLNLLGKYYYKDIAGKLNVDINQKEVSFYLDSEKIKNLKFLKDFFRLPKIAESWMYDNIQGDMYLSDFYGKFDLVNNRIIEKSLVGNAVIDNANIMFHKDLKKIQTYKIDINFKNNALSLNLVKPIYDGINIDGSNVIINNIASEKNGEVLVNIKTKSILDERILEILKAYHVYLPLKQLSGQTDASVNLTIPYSEKKQMQTKGKFIVKDSELLINGFSLKTKEAKVFLNNNKIDISSLDVSHDDMFNTKIDMSLDTNTLLANGNVDIRYFLIKTDESEIIHLKNKKSPISFDFNDSTKISLSDINTFVKIDENINVNISNMASLYSSSKLMQDLSIKDAELFLKIKPNNDILFTAFAKGLSFPIYKEGKIVDSLNVEGKISDNNVTVLSEDKNIKVEVKDKDLFLTLKNYDVRIDTKSEDKKNIPNMNIEVSDVNLTIDDKNYFIKNASLDILNQDISFVGKLENLDIPISLNAKKVDKLELKALITKDSTNISTIDEKIKIVFKEKELSLDIKDYDLLFNTKEEKTNDFENININGKNSNIIVNEKFKFLANDFNIRVRNDSKYLHLTHNKTDITFKETKDKKIDIFANDISDVFINALFDKNILKGGNLMFVGQGTLEDLKGKIIIENSKVEDLAILNNLLLFIHTSPGLINPLLAIPSVVGLASNKGFNLTGYKVVDGIIELNYLIQKDLIHINKLVTVGNGIDFDGKGQIDLNTNSIDSQIKLIFFKNYSNLVGFIPVVNYVLLGKDNRVETLVNIFGPLENPKIKTNLTKDAFSIPLNIAKRILTSPSEFIKFIKNEKK